MLQSEQIHLLITLCVLITACNGQTMGKSVVNKINGIENAKDAKAVVKRGEMMTGTNPVTA